MNQPEKPKRIVSKAAYACWMIKKGSLATIGTILMVASIYTGAAIATVMVLGIILWFLMLFLSGRIEALHALRGSSAFFLWSLSLGVMALLTYWLGKLLFSRSMRIAPVLPMTHANTAHLPLVDSLVRASSEPMQEQQSVLLRASIHSQQIPSDQLLRAVEE